MIIKHRFLEKSCKISENKKSLTDLEEKYFIEYLIDTISDNQQNFGVELDIRECNSELFIGHDYNLLNFDKFYNKLVLYIPKDLRNKIFFHVKTPKFFLNEKYLKDGFTYFTGQEFFSEAFVYLDNKIISKYLLIKDEFSEEDMLLYKKRYDKIFYLSCYEGSKNCYSCYEEKMFDGVME